MNAYTLILYTMHVDRYSNLLSICSLNLLSNLLSNIYSLIYALIYSLIYSKIYEELFVVKYEFRSADQQSGLKPHIDGTPWSFVVTLNDSKEYGFGGTRFIHSGATYRPAKPGTAVMFSGKNLHEGIEVTSGVRYILTGFCEYVDECDEDHPTPHSVFLKSYDRVYDGEAAAGGIRTGDIIRGIYNKGGGSSSSSSSSIGCRSGVGIGGGCRNENSQRGDLVMLDDDNTISKVLNDIKADTIAKSKGDKDASGLKEFTFLLERLLSTDYEDCLGTEDKEEVGGGGEGIGIAACSKELTSAELDLKDDREILDLIHNVDQFLTVGVYFKFDELY